MNSWSFLFRRTGEAFNLAVLFTTQYASSIVNLQPLQVMQPTRCWKHHSGPVEVRPKNFKCCKPAKKTHLKPVTNLAEHTWLWFYSAIRLTNPAAHLWRTNINELPLTLPWRDHLQTVGAVGGLPLLQRLIKPNPGGKSSQRSTCLGLSHPSTFWSGSTVLRWKSTQHTPRDITM